MHYKLHAALIKYIFISLSVLMLSGCGVWENFTTYFNLYYNAKDTFEQAEKAIDNQKEDIFSTKPPQLPGSARGLLKKVEEKCSNILQFHKNSGYVDDALLMLGKTFFYQQDYRKSLRKFQELLATQPHSDLVLEANLWIGKVQMQLRNYDDGQATLENVKDEAIKKGDDDIIREAFVEEIKYHISQQDYSGAIGLASDFLKVSDDSEVNAEVEYELGKLYDLVDDTSNAIVSFRNVFNYSPSYDVKVNSLIQLGSELRDAGKPDTALIIFNNMKDEAKYSDHYSEIDLQRGVTQLKLNNFKTAIGILKMVDSSYASTPSSGIARFELAKIYETHFNNYDSASVYYSRAVSSSAPPDTLTEARQKNALFSKYNLLSQKLIDEKKQLLYALQPEEFVKDSIAFYSDTLDNKKNTSNVTNEENRVVRKEVENRRFSQTQRTPQQKSQPRQNPPVRPHLSTDSLKTILVKSEFDMGNLFFTEFNLPDSAYYYYTSILANYPNSSYQARTMYALGSYYLTENNEKKADSLFNIIYENYKNERIVNAAADKLGKPLIDFNFDPAKPLYEKAEKTLLKGSYDTTLTQLYHIYKAHHSSPYAAKSLYTSGWILVNKLSKPDSAAVVYDTLVKNYPQTVYATAVNSELNTYKQEQIRIKRAIEDSIKQTQQKLNASADSSGKKSNTEKLSEKPEKEPQGKITGEDNSKSEQRDKIIEAKREEEAQKQKFQKNNTVPKDTLIRGDFRRHRKKIK